MIICLSQQHISVDLYRYHWAFRHSELDDLESFVVVGLDGFYTFAVLINTAPGLASRTWNLALIINTLARSRNRNHQEQQEVLHR